MTSRSKNRPSWFGESSVQLNMQPVQATILGRAWTGNLPTDLHRVNSESDTSKDKPE
jgi:hypothetical protein